MRNHSASLFSVLLCSIMAVAIRNSRRAIYRPWRTRGYMFLILHGMVSGTEHSNQVRELVLNNTGIDLSDVYVAEGQVLMGSARVQKETEDRRQLIRDEIAYKRVSMERDRQIAELKARLRAVTQDLDWKQKEAIFLDTSEGARVDRERVVSTTRADRRRADNDGDKTASRSRRKKKL